MNGYYVGSIIYNPKTACILLQKRDLKAPVNPGLWGIFGGSSEGNENPKQTLIRELKEELGIDIDEKSMNILLKYFNEKRQRYSYIFSVDSQVAKSEMKLSEGEDFDWVPVEEVLSLDLTNSSRRAISIFLSSHVR